MFMTTDSYKNNKDGSYAVFTILCDNCNFCCANDDRTVNS